MNGTDCISKLWESNEVLWTACLTNIYQMLNSISFSTDCYHLVSNASYMYFRVYFIYVHIPPSGGSTKKKKKKGLYRCSRVLQHNMIGLLNTWTHSGYDNMHRIIQDQVSQNSSMEFCDQGSQGYTKTGRSSWSPNPSWEVVGYKRENRFSSGMQPQEGCPCSIKWSSTHAHRGSTK